MPRSNVPSRPRACSHIWPRVAVLALVGVAAASCSDSGRFDSNPYASNRQAPPPQQEDDRLDRIAPGLQRPRRGAASAGADPARHRRSQRRLRQRRARLGRLSARHFQLFPKYFRCHRIGARAQCGGTAAAKACRRLDLGRRRAGDRRLRRKRRAHRAQTRRAGVCLIGDQWHHESGFDQARPALGYSALRLASGLRAANSGG